MAKLWPSVSVVLVFIMLLFLAPTLLLMPAQIVSADGDAVTEEIQANFSFTVDGSGGDWYVFQAGSGGVQGTPPRLALVQYTRPNLLVNGTTANVSGCGFRNYTTGSGTVTGTVGNLNGTMTLEWITFRFNKTYTLSPKYMTAVNFGWMSGRGHYYDTANSNDNFTFVFVADFDCNGDMTVAAGKGFIESVEENGRFGNMADPPEDRHHIMGSLYIALSSGTYTGNFSLRNYPPEEVYDEGQLNVTGGVLQENTDAITTGSLKILNMTSDGSMTTPPDTLWPVGFEEIDWGRDPIKTINASERLGTNATMDITRDSVLYLSQSKPGGGDIVWVRIQANPICILHINDTYAVTGPDNSPYGELWELLLLSLPQQYLEVNQTDPNYFNQTGYTFNPFGPVNGKASSATGCYAGTESFANAEIHIQAVVGQALQWSRDMTYGLFPHPKVETVFPSAGVAGATMKVKITGKYFTRAAGQKSGFVPNSGSVSFGSGITVNDYTITSSAVDDQIIANITIDGGASTGSRDVNVTSCFGYSSGSGSAPYESGVKSGGFSVVGTGATMEGHASLVRKAGASWITPLDVRMFEAGGNLTFEQFPASGTTNATGVFVLSGRAPGTYDIGIKNWTSLSKLSTNVALTDNATTVVNFGTIVEGDCNHAGVGTDRVNFDDYIDVLVNYGAAYWKADFDRSGTVSFDDYITVLVNYGKQGDLYGK